MNYEKRPSGLWMPETKTVKQPIAVGGFYVGEIIRRGKAIDKWEEHNVVVYQGLDSLLSVYFAAAPQITSWYFGIFSGNYAPNATDTANSIPGNSTEFQSYTSQTRPQFQVSEGSQQASNSAAPASFTFNSPASIYGAFLISSSGKGSTSGTLFSASQFTTSKTLSSGDQLNLTYVVGAASS